MKPTPPYLHITKRGQKQNDPPKLPGNGQSNNRQWLDKYGPFSQSGRVSEKPVMRTFSVPIHYFVTVNKIIEAENSEEAHYKAQAIEAPPINVEGFSDSEMTIESEVNVYDMEEVD